VSARERILQRLCSLTAAAQRLEPSDVPVVPGAVNQRQLLQTFTARMRAVKGEVAACDRDEIAGLVGEWLLQAGAKRLLAGRDPRLDALIEHLPGSLQCLRMTPAFEQARELLFHSVDAGISHCDGAIADTGSLVIASSAAQPRTVSLVPPLHVALLPAASIRQELADLLQDWSGRPLPTNLLLISGPSKSADIEQLLAYGVHGPKRLLTVVYE
jgi:L-lactate dehydrogenase complex protein LldG